MDKKPIINFSKFYSDNKQQNNSQVEKKKELIVEKKKIEKKPLKESKDKEKEVSYPKEISKIIEEPEVDKAFDPPVDPESFIIEDPKEFNYEDENLPSLDNKNNFNKVEENYYPVFKDKFESFTCNVLVEGAKLHNTKARLILESEDWNLVFEGDIDQTGKCTIPIKKLNILDEGTVGKIRLEVIADNTIFSPWEDDFKVRLSKKVEVQVPRKEIPKETSVQVKFKG
jgi:hypothetical protein